MQPNIVDRLTEWVDRKDNETVGRWYIRILCGVFWASSVIGFMWGLLLGSMVWKL